MAENIISRMEARAQGLKRYFTGQPCCHGHLAERQTCNQLCFECARVRKRERRQSADFRAQEAEWQKQDRKVHPERYRERDRKWRSKATSKALKALIQRKRRARKRQAGGDHTREDVAEILISQKYRCAYCRRTLKGKKFECDHIIPIASGGNNERRNIQILCARCNRTKRTKDPIRFARELGKLL
jgi:5-methylcytosine-specific restriction endonuclease McrA